MIKHVLTTAALSISMGLATVHAADMGAKDEPIKLAINEWTGQHISTHIAGEALKRPVIKLSM